MRTAAETVRDHPGLQFSFYLETVRLYRCFFFHIYVKEINCRRSVKGEDMKKRRWICMFLLLQVLWCSMTGMAVYGMEPDIPVSAVVSGQAQAVSIQAPSAVLMEASTGKLLFEKDADEKRSPASVTKVMTLLLIFDALKAGKIQMTDQVTTSAYAKSMGGSQVFLEEGETQTVETLIKCIVIASGNDASVAMAEYISGTEEAFVQQMNERAEGLGMTKTHFVDCCGLTEDPSHVTTARDIALMSRELIDQYPQIHNYSTIWMENITHVTKQGTKEFGLSNTNKLLRMATNFKVTGLKTGSTSLAKYCLSATAEKDGVRLIASIMAAPDFKARFADAQTLLNYGFSVCRKYEDRDWESLKKAVKVKRGETDQVEAVQEQGFSYVDVSGTDLSGIEKKVLPDNSLEAPVKKGQKAGKVQYLLGGKTIGEVDLVTTEEVPAMSLKKAIEDVLDSFSL